MSLTDQADLVKLQLQRAGMAETLRHLADDVAKVPLERVPTVLAVLRPHVDAVRDGLSEVV